MKINYVTYDILPFPFKEIAKSMIKIKAVVEMRMELAMTIESLICFLLFGFLLSLEFKKIILNKA